MYSGHWADGRRELVHLGDHEIVAQRTIAGPRPPEIAFRDRRLAEPLRHPRQPEETIRLAAHVPALDERDHRTAVQALRFFGLTVHQRRVGVSAPRLRE